MIVVEWIRFVLAALLLLIGLFAILSSVIGLFRFTYVINRIHASDLIETLAVLCISLSLILMMGFDPAVLKLILIIVFIWLANPISGHLMARLEVMSNPQIGNEYEVVHRERD